MSNKKGNQKKGENTNEINESNEIKEIKEIVLPYNFIPLPKAYHQAYKEGKLPKHNEVEDNGISGYIDYEIEPHGPLALEIRKTLNNEPFIIGSSIRGKIRSNAEILSASYPDFVDKTTMLFRDVGKKHYRKKLIGNKKIQEVIRVGILKYDGKRYFISPLKPIDSNINFLAVEERDLLKEDILNESEKLYKFEDKKRIQNHAYRPYEKKIIYYKMNDEKVFLTKENKNGFLKGYLFNSTNAGRKKRHYLFSAEEIENKIEVPDETIETYKKAFKNMKLEGEIKDFYNIFDKESPKEAIVFFKVSSESNKSLIVGRTPYFRVEYKNQIKDLLDRIRKSGYNYAEALFGFVKQEESNKAYKSRLRFSCLDVIGDNNYKVSDEKFVLMTPRASASGMYLKQNKGEKIKTYENDNVALRGLKYYHVRKEPVIIKDNEIKEMNKDILSHKRVINENEKKQSYRLKGKIDFNNLSQKELGLLLLSLDIRLIFKTERFKKKENQMRVKNRIIVADNLYELIGGAKPYGYGKVKINIKHIKRQKDGVDVQSILHPYESYDSYIHCIDEFLNKMNQNELLPLIKRYLLSKMPIEENGIKEWHQIDPNDYNNTILKEIVID